MLNDMKDIFIDTNIASRFCNPLDAEYKKLIKWLLHFDGSKPQENAALVVSRKLLSEYVASARETNAATSIPVIVDLLFQQGRRVLITNDEIKQFKTKHFKKKVVNCLLCNAKDRDHIPVVLLSNRKYALSLDDNFVRDLLKFPGFKVQVAKRPEHLPYSK
jgi:hypothetical protein